MIQTKLYYYDCKHEDITEPIRGKMNARNMKEVLVFLRNHVAFLTNTDNNDACKTFKHTVTVLRN